MVRVLHVGDGELVAEWVEGADLGAVVARCGPLPAGLAAFVAREAALGLAAVHRAGVLHRDVSAGNVLIGQDGTVRLTDFGLASLADAVADEVRGTLGTLAPEVVRGDPATARSDLFSLGAVLAHALTGRPPFEGDGPSAVLDAVLHQDPAAALAVDPRVPAALAEAAAALLSKGPEARPADAEAAAARLAHTHVALGAPGADDLAAFLDDPASYRPPRVADPAPPDVRPAPAEVAPAQPDRRRRRTAWPVALAVVLGISTLVGLAVATSGPAETPTPVAEPAVVAPVDIADRADRPPDSLVADEPASALPNPPPPDLDGATGASPPARDERPGAPTPRPPPQPDPTPPVRPSPAPSSEPDRPAPQAGSLAVSAEPWARVRVGDRDLGTTPATVSLPAGDHVVTLTNPEFPTYTVRVRVEPGEQTRAAVSLWSLVAQIQVEVSPWATVTVDGVEWDTVPPQARPLVLAPGAHVLEFAHPTLGTREVRLEVAAGERRTVRVRMGEN